MAKLTKFFFGSHFFVLIRKYQKYQQLVISILEKSPKSTHLGVNITSRDTLLVSLFRNERLKLDENTSIFAILIEYGMGFSYIHIPKIWQIRKWFAKTYFIKYKPLISDECLYYVATSTSYGGEKVH